MLITGVSKKLLFIVLLAFLLRLISLNQSLWLDEAISANVARNYSYLGIIKNFSPSDFHPPLYYLVLKTWTSVFGFSEISLRFPSVLFSLLTGYFVYLIGAKLKNKNIGLWSATFFLFNPLIIYYSQEARMYSLVTLFLTIASYSYLTNRSKLFCLFSFLSFLTFYGSIFFIATILIWQFMTHGFRKTLPFVWGALAAIFVVFPLLKYQYLGSKSAVASVLNWSFVLGKANLKNLLMVPLKFALGRISFYPKTVYYLVSGLWSLFIFVTALFSASKFLSFIFFFPLIIAFLVSFSSPMLQYFRYLYLIPVLSLLLSQFPSKTLKIISVSGFLALSLIYLLLPQFHREDWKSLSGSLPPRSTVYMVPSFSDPLVYYRSDLTVKDINSINSSDFISSITVLPYGFTIHGIDHKTKLSSLGFSQSSESTYRELSKESWQPSPLSP